MASKRKENKCIINPDGTIKKFEEIANLWPCEGWSRFCGALDRKENVKNKQHDRGTWGEVYYVHRARRPYHKQNPHKGSA